jgi:hypothetical protein
VSRVRKFDHDAAYERVKNGESIPDVAASIGVNQNAVREIVKRRDIPGFADDLRTYHRERQRRALRRPCIRGCGRLAWQNPNRPGVCAECYRAERHAEAEARDSHGTEARYRFGCRCDECRTEATAAKRRRREASRLPCSHGCGTLVDSINRRRPDKPLECLACARRRIAQEKAAA